MAGGLALALASALALDVGFLIQQRAAASAPALSLRRPGSWARSLLGSRRWIAGFVLGLGGWALYVAALTLAPLSLVQTVAASAIGLLVLLTAIATRTVPVRRERIGAMLSTLGLMALALSAGRSDATTSRAPSTAALCALAAAALIVAACALRGRSASLGGLAAGLLYGVGDVTGKSLLIALPHHPGAGALLSSPLLYATAGAHGLGFVALQRAFQHGGAISSLGPMTAAANLVPMAAGVLLLGEHLPSGAPATALRLAAFAAAAGGAWALASRGAPPAGDARGETSRGLRPSLSATAG
jgi:drug/metabolite transporter (DMT)-like permease